MSYNCYLSYLCLSFHLFSVSESMDILILIDPIKNPSFHQMLQINYKPANTSEVTNKDLSTIQ